MQEISTLLRYEFFNLFRNRWLLAFTAFLFIITLALIQFGGDNVKLSMSLLNLAIWVVPCLSILFSALYWYNNDAFAHTLLAQPVTRNALVLSRWISTAATLFVCMMLGVIAPLILRGYSGGSVVFLAFATMLLTLIFVSLGILIAIICKERLLGIGVLLGALFYFLILHDGVLFLTMMLFRQYPLEIPVLVLSSLNPITLLRLLGLFQFDTSALLGYTGMILQRHFQSGVLSTFAYIVTGAWVTVPLYFSIRVFSKKDLN